MRDWRDRISFVWRLHLGFLFGFRIDLAAAIHFPDYRALADDFHGIPPVKLSSQTRSFARGAARPMLRRDRGRYSFGLRWKHPGKGTAAR